jgi:ABC-type transport system involved in multi-copper enzyme maturation permease subunit
LARGVLEKIAGKLKIVGVANTLLGAFVGVLGFTLLVSVVLAVFAILPIGALNNAFNNSILVGAIYKYNPVIWLLGLLL